VVADLTGVKGCGRMKVPLEVTMRIRASSILVAVGLLLLFTVALTVRMLNGPVFPNQRAAPADEPCIVRPIEPATAEMIRRGMTKSAVHALLGRPPGDYVGEPVQVMGAATTLARAVRTERWIGHDHAISVLFDDSGEVERVDCYEVIIVSKFLRDHKPD
jgi:hypothetical protein